MAPPRRTATWEDAAWSWVQDAPTKITDEHMRRAYMLDKELCAPGKCKVVPFFCLASPACLSGLGDAQWTENGSGGAALAEVRKRREKALAALAESVRSADLPAGLKVRRAHRSAGGRLTCAPSNQRRISAIRAT